MNNANKVQVRIDSTDAGKIVEIELTRDTCEGIYALCQVLGAAMGGREESIKSAVAEVLQQVPKDSDGIIEVPFTAEAAVSVLSLCCFAAKKHPEGAHMSWVGPLHDSIQSALKGAGVRCQVLLDTVAVFTSP